MSLELNLQSISCNDSSVSGVEFLWLILPPCVQSPLSGYLAGRMLQTRVYARYLEACRMRA